MPKKYNNVYQFKITLRGVKPPIWRRIQVPETCTFSDLSSAIQDAMGWDGYHLHEFNMVNPVSGFEAVIGVLDDDFGIGREILQEGKCKISDWFSPENKSAEYVYDFGDNWEHQVRLEKILPRETGVKYPRCAAGKRACPPEDCGGPWGYMRLLEIISNPEDEEYEDMRDWLDEEFDPEYFDENDVVFLDPSKRWKGAF